MVPIVEPEVLMDGDHSAEDCFNKTSEVIKRCYEELILNKVDLKGTILKPNMILPGNKSKEKISSAEIAKLTVKCLKNSVPTEVPGIAFLCVGRTLDSIPDVGRISEEEDDDAITRRRCPFSLGRGLVRRVFL